MMPPMARIILLLLLAVFLTGAATPPPVVEVPARKQELALRQADMLATLAQLEKRRANVPASIEDFRATLAKIYDARKGLNDTGYMFRGGDVDNVVHNRMFGGKPSPVECLDQFNRQLAARGIDLILLPCPNQVQVHAHRLFKDIGPDQDIWPAYTDGMIQLSQRGIEVIDLTDAFRAYKGDGDVVHAFYHHWGSAGMALAAQAVSQRLQRYAFVRDAGAGRDRFTPRNIQTPMPSDLFAHHNSIPYGKWHVGAKIDGVPEHYQATQILYDGKVLRTDKIMGDRIDPVLVLGDSTVFHLSWQHGGEGAGFPEHLSMALGFPVAQYGRAAGGPKAALNYARDLSSRSPQPRVVILSMVMYDMVGTNWPLADLKPVGDGQGGQAASTQPAQALTVQGRVAEAVPAPDTVKSPYKDAVSFVVVTLPAEPGKEPRRVLVGSWVMQDRKLEDWATLRVGQSLNLTLLPWKEAIAAEPYRASAMRLEPAGEDALSLPMYWAVAAEPVSDETRQR